MPVLSAGAASILTPTRADAEVCAHGTGDAGTRLCTIVYGTARGHTVDWQLVGPVGDYWQHRWGYVRPGFLGQAPIKQLAHLDAAD